MPSKICSPSVRHPGPACHSLRVILKEQHGPELAGRPMLISDQIVRPGQQLLSSRKQARAPRSEPCRVRASQGVRHDTVTEVAGQQLKTYRIDSPSEVASSSQSPAEDRKLLSLPGTFCPSFTLCKLLMGHSAVHHHESSPLCDFNICMLLHMCISHRLHGCSCQKSLLLEQSFGCNLDRPASTVRTKAGDWYS